MIFCHMSTPYHHIPHALNQSINLRHTPIHCNAMMATVIHWMHSCSASHSSHHHHHSSIGCYCIHSISSYNTAPSHSFIISMYRARVIVFHLHSIPSQLSSPFLSNHVMIIIVLSTPIYHSMHTHVPTHPCTSTGMIDSYHTNQAIHRPAVACLPSCFLSIIQSCFIHRLLDLY